MFAALSKSRTTSLLTWIAWLALALVVLAAAYVVWFIATLDARIERARTLAAHTYPANHAQHLTEARALELAPDLLRRAGMEPDDWEMQEDDRAAAPDGTPERYLVRNTLNPNDGSILLYRRPDADGPGPKTPVTLVFELRNDEIEARLWLNK